MDDYISRQDAIVTAVRAVLDWHRLENPQYSIAYCIDQAMRGLPSTDVQPVRHSRWIESDTDGFVCSVCRNGYRNQPTLMGKPMFEYCPVCGARMDEGSE